VRVSGGRPGRGRRSARDAGGRLIAPRRRPAGFILLEILVTIVILVFGLFGLAGFQLRATVAESEAYQRAQALILVQDMVDRVYANRAVAATYADTELHAQPVGTGDAEPAPAACADADAGLDRDICEWSNALKGAGEGLRGNNVGTMIGGRGCITASGPNEYVVTVAWQGIAPTVAPSGTDCGRGLYGNDALRRAVSMRVVISTLDNGTL
jgi:type IV pilus assembly protein PilV